MTRLTFALASIALVGCGDDSADRDSCPAGSVCRWAGTGKLGYNNLEPGAHRLDSRLYFPQDLTFGPDGRGYIIDFNNHRVRRAELDGSLVDIMGSDYEGDGPPQMQDRLPLCAAEGAPGTTVALNHPSDATFGPDGKLYVAAWHNNKIRVYDPETDLVTAIGDGYGYAGEGAEGCHALFNQPKSVEIAPDGTIYTIDQRNVRIRKVAMGATDRIEDAIVTTIAGRGVPGDTGDGGDAMLAQFGFETGTTPRTTGSLVLDGNTLYVADSANNRIRRIDLTTGIISAFAGRPEAGYSGDGGAALDAQFNFPTDMEMGPDHRLYVADTYNNVVRAIDLTTNTVETVVGSGASCDTSKEVCPDVSPVAEATFDEPYGIAFDNDGALYIADSHNHRVMKVAR